MCHGLLDVALGLSKRGVSNVKPREESINQIAIGSYECYIVMVGIQTCTHVAVPHTVHFTLSWKAHQFNSYFPRYSL